MSCWEEKWLDDKTNMTSHLIPKKDRLHCDRMVMSSLRHITPSSRHIMMSNVLQSLLDRSFLVSGYLSGKYHALFITWSFSIMLYHPFSHTMSYAPILTHLQTNSFLTMTFFLCPCWFICSHNPLHFPNDLTNRSHPPSCLCPLLLFYLWVACLWSFCHSHSFCT